MVVLNSSNILVMPKPRGAAIQKHLYGGIELTRIFVMPKARAATIQIHFFVRIPWLEVSEKNIVDVPFCVYFQGFLYDFMVNIIFGLGSMFGSILGFWFLF